MPPKPPERRKNDKPGRRGRPAFLGVVQALVLRLPEELHATVKDLARESGRSMNDLLVEAVREKYGRKMK